MMENKEASKALLRASKKGNVEECKMQIDLGGNVNGYDKKSPLYCASVNGHKEVCRLLVSENAKMNERNREGNVPLIGAVIKGRKNVYEYLIQEGANINYINRGGYTALMEAVKKGKKELCEYLIQEGADVNIRGYYGQRALKEAAFSGKLEICKLLVEKGAKIKAQEIHVAIKQKREDMYYFFVEKGGNIRGSDHYSNSLLQTAIIYNNLQICEDLIQRGIDVNEDNELRGETALHLASEKETNIQICKLLIEKGANVYYENNKGQTALVLAGKNRRKDICELIVRKIKEERNEEQQEENCNICYETIQKEQKTYRCQNGKCKMKQHKKCIQKWKEKGGETCPNCRSKI